MLREHIHLEVHKRPLRSPPSVVAAHVCGISETPNRSPASDATVRLTPSTAIEPFSTT